MLIRSQDREKLYNLGISFNSLQYFEDTSFKKGNKEKQVRHTICISDGCLEEIGEYESKERCIEILDKIQGAYLGCLTRDIDWKKKGGALHGDNKERKIVYQMPVMEEKEEQD